MEHIKKRLQELQLWNSVVECELRALWKYGIERISDEEIRKSIILFLEQEAPDGFFVNPAATSDKYHPKWQNEKYGILRNTVECCVLADRLIMTKKELCNNFDNPLPDARDIVLAATILSDTFKYGTEIVEPHSGSGKSLKDHGKIAAREWWKTFPETPEIDSTTEKGMEIYSATYWHLGRWTPGWTPGIQSKFTPCMEIVQTLDMIFADKGLELLYTPKHIIE